MSAIGSYVVLPRARFPHCLELARNVRNETTGKWLFKKTETVGLDAFRTAWQESVIKEETFGYSGYVLGDYLLAQEEINKVQLVDEEAEVSTLLNKVFLAAFVFEESISLPNMSDDQLLEYARDERGEEGDEMVEPLKAAHEFFRQGLVEITAENLVVFLMV
jgi:hypothetical protein